MTVITKITNKIKNSLPDLARLKEQVNQILSYVTENNSHFSFNSLAELTQDEYLAGNGNWLKALPYITTTATITDKPNSHTVATLYIKLNKDLKPTNLIIHDFKNTVLYSINQEDIDTILLQNDLNNSLNITENKTAKIKI